MGLLHGFTKVFLSGKVYKNLRENLDSERSELFSAKNGAHKKMIIFKRAERGILNGYNILFRFKFELSEFVSLCYSRLSWFFRAWRCFVVGRNRISFGVGQSEFPEI